MFVLLVVAWIDPKYSCNNRNNCRRQCQGNWTRDLDSEGPGRKFLCDWMELQGKRRPDIGTYRTVMGKNNTEDQGVITTKDGQEMAT